MAQLRGTFPRKRGALYLIAAIFWLSALLAGDNVVGAAVSFTAVMTTMVALFSSLHGTAVLVSARRRAPAEQLGAVAAGPGQTPR